MADPEAEQVTRPGQHEALISYETFHRIQDRLAGVNRLPKRQNLNADFPLRGFVLCADCGTPLTACWSTGNKARHPYYLCPKRGCASYGKSTRRDTIEGEFEALLRGVQPTEGLFRMATAMFRDLWDHRSERSATQKKALEAQLAKIGGQVSQLLARIIDSSVPAVIGAYEEKVRKLESDKLLIRERLASAGRSVSSFDDTLRTALAFLANPSKLWASERLEDRRTVLKLTFAERLSYKRNEGFRTANLSLPFRMLAGFLPGQNEVARPAGLEPATLGFEARYSIQLS